jgi:hypothetical protein
MPNNSNSETALHVKNGGYRPLDRAGAKDGYQPSRALTSNPPRGRSVVPPPAPAKSSASSAVKSGS